MPTPTDLVTSLPADFEVFGQAVDSTMADLKGGTSGQILSKNSNTDMDFVWITNDQGDITGVTAGTGLTGGGTSGAVTLNVDPTYAGFTNLNDTANPVLNSAFQIAQRGTSVAVAAGFNAYTLDRWMYGAGGVGSASTISQQLTNDSTNLPFIQYCARIQRNAGQTGTTPNSISQTFENSNSAPFIGKTVTLSFYARAGANYSTVGNNFIFRVYSGTSTNGNVQTGPWANIAIPVEANVTLTTTWQRFQATGTVSSTATQLALYALSTPTGTAGAADYVEMTGIQLEIGSVATPFRTNGATFQAELAACQRYLPAIQASASDIAVGQCYATTATLISIPFPVTARVAPTGVTVNSAGNFRLRGATSTTITTTSVLFSTASTQSASLDANVASGLVAGNATNLYNAGSGTILFTGCEL